VYGVCIEGPSLHSTNQADKLGQVRGVLELVSMDYLSFPHEIPPTSLKKFATGYGHASKDKMMQTALQAGWDVRNDDEADAAWLTEIARALHEDDLPLTRKQLEALRGIQNIGQAKDYEPRLQRQLNV
jgi:crossover junction endodeoxyribonuclease RuvC